MKVEDIQAKVKEFIVKNNKQPTYLLINGNQYNKFVRSFTPKERIKKEEVGQYKGVVSIYLEDGVKLDILKMGDQQGIEII